MDDFENNTELSTRTDAHLKHLGLMIDGETQVGAETLKSAHERLRKDLKAFVNDFRKHRKETFKITEYVIDSEQFSRQPKT